MFLKSDFFKNSESMQYKNDVVEQIASIKADQLVVLTGSDEDLVKAFLQNDNRIFYDDVIGSKVKSDFFRVKRHPFGRGKCKYVNSDNYNIGIANDRSDHFYMDMCNEQYYIKKDVWT